MVCGSDPVRAYLYRGGTLVMSDKKLSARPRPSDFMVLFQTSTTPTDLRFFHQLNATLSEAQMEALWQQIEVGGAGAGHAVLPWLLATRRAAAGEGRPDVESGRLPLPMLHSAGLHSSNDGGGGARDAARWPGLQHLPTSDDLVRFFRRRLCR